MSQILESAMQYTSEGLAIFPTQYRSKSPMGSWKVYQYVQPSNQIERFKGANGQPLDCGIAVAGGIGSGNLLVIDVDHPDIFFGATKHDKAFQEMISETKTSFSLSGKPHYYFKTEIPLRSKSPKNDFGIDILGMGSYAVIPPTEVSKNGQLGLYTWKDPKKKILTLSRSEINSLAERLNFPFKEWEPIESDFKFKPHGMNWKIFRLIQSGNYEDAGFYEGGTQSRSEADFHIILHLISLGWNDSKIFQYLNNFGKCLRMYERGSQFIWDEISRAVLFFQNSVSESKKQIIEFQEMVQNLDWKSISNRTAVTDRMVAEYIGHVAMRSKKTTSISLPQREISEQIGRSRESVKSSLNRLKTIGIIEQNRSAGLFTGAEYDLKKTHSLVQSNTFLYSNDWTNTCVFSSSDAWRKSRNGSGSLLKTGLLVYRMIQAHPGISTKVITEKLNGTVALRTVQAKVKRLLEIDAIHKIKNEYRVSGKTENEIAEAIGSLGAEEKQKRFHSLERELQKRTAGLSKDDRATEKKKFHFSHNKHLVRISSNEFLNPRTGEIFTIQDSSK